MAAVTLAGTAASIGATHMQARKAEKAQKEAYKLERKRAQKLEGIGDENLEIFKGGIEESTGPKEAEAVAGREQAKAQALAAAGPGVEMQLPAGQSGVVAQEFGKSIEDGKGAAASQAAASNALSAFGDRLAVGRRAVALRGSKIASNNNAAQVLANMPYYVRQESSPLADILGAAGSLGTMYGVMGAPGLTQAPPVGRPRAPIIGPNGMAGTV